MRVFSTLLSRSNENELTRSGCFTLYFLTCNDWFSIMFVSTKKVVIPAVSSSFRHPLDAS